MLLFVLCLFSFFEWLERHTDSTGRRKRNVVSDWGVSAGTLEVHLRTHTDPPAPAPAM